MGATVTVMTAATAAVPTKQTIDARDYDRVLFAAPGLAGAETAQIYLGGGADWALATMPDGTPAKLTAAYQSLELPGGMYGIDKSATVAAVGVSATLLNR